MLAIGCFGEMSRCYNRQISLRDGKKIDPLGRKINDVGELLINEKQDINQRFWKIVTISGLSKNISEKC